MSERILIIDDDVELCELVTRLLVREGFAVEAAHNGESGSRQATDGDYQLVVLDVMMPEMNGFDVLRRVRAASSRVPVLMLTARGDDRSAFTRKPPLTYTNAMDRTRSPRISTASNALRA